MITLITITIVAATITLLNVYAFHVVMDMMTHQRKTYEKVVKELRETQQKDDEHRQELTAIMDAEREATGEIINAILNQNEKLHGALMAMKVESAIAVDHAVVGLTGTTAYERVSAQVTNDAIAQTTEPTEFQTVGLD